MIFCVVLAGVTSSCSTSCLQRGQRRVTTLFSSKHLRQQVCLQGRTTGCISIYRQQGHQQSLQLIRACRFSKLTFLSLDVEVFCLRFFRWELNLRFARIMERREDLLMVGKEVITLFFVQKGKWLFDFFGSLPFFETPMLC